MPITMTVGQSINLTAEPLMSGAPGGELPGPVTWSHNMSSGSCLFDNTTGETINVTIQTVNSDSVFAITATCGTLSDTIDINAIGTVADGLQITAGPVT